MKIKDWKDLDEKLREAGELERQINLLRLRFEKRTAELKNRFNLLIGAHEKEQKVLLDEVEKFLRENVSDLSGKTFEGEHGRCGLRLTPPSVKPAGKMTWERVLSRILELGYQSKLLRPIVHTVKDIDRELLASDRINDDIRKEIGVRLHQEERFWWEAK